MDVVWMVSEGCVDGFKRVYRGCLDFVWILFVCYLDSV